MMNKTGLITSTYDFVANVQVRDGIFYVENEYNPCPYPGKTICDSQQELATDGITNIYRHNVLCDVTRLRLNTPMSIDTGEYFQQYNAIHLFNYIAHDPKFVEGIARLNAFNQDWLMAIYHELRHAFNYRAMLRYPHQITYETYALDELMCICAEYLAKACIMSELSGPVVSVTVNYQTGGRFNAKIIQNLINSVMDNALYNLENNPIYKKWWHQEEQKPFQNYTNPRSYVRLNEVWKEMRTFYINKRPIDLFDYITPENRQRALALIYSR